MKKTFFPFLKAICLCAVVLATSGGCKRDPAEVECEGMFGLPVAATGLDQNFCKPSCECLGFTSKTFTASQLATLRQWQLDEPFGELTSNPYDEAAPERDEAVCAIVVEDLGSKVYRLESYPGVAEAEAAGAILTHHDACGLCSTLPDFAVYAEDRDIGASVRACGLSNFAQPFDSLVNCIAALGFTRPCAQIWAYNVRNTQQMCLQECLADTTYHLPDGSLGPCLECDELNSGPVFKAVAGRTRRNTGLASSICRFCGEVQPVEHDYPF